MDYRVTLEFALRGDPPTQAVTDRLRARFAAAAASERANPVVEPGLGRMRVTLTFDAVDAEAAAARARLVASAVIGSGAVAVDVEPAECASG